MYKYVCGLCPNTKFTRPARLGYRCLTSSEVYDNITGVLPYTCVHRCIRRNNCSLVNYDVRKNICFLSNDCCIYLEENLSFQVNYLSSTQHSDCLEWVASSKFEEITPVRFRNDGYVGRLRLSPHVLPGKYLRSHDKVWSVMGGNEVNGADLEILAVRLGCHVIWMPFRAGDTLPVEAVQGGYLSIESAPLFVVRGLVNGRNVSGYFDPLASLGYLALYGVNYVTDMEILVLLWALPWPW